jgi:hypothetical protein
MRQPHAPANTVTGSAVVGCLLHSAAALSTVGHCDLSRPLESIWTPSFRFTGKPRPLYSANPLGSSHERAVPLLSALSFAEHRQNRGVAPD